MAAQTQETRNVWLNSNCLLNGFGNIDEEIHLYQTGNGRLARECAPKDTAAVLEPVRANLTWS